MNHEERLQYCKVCIHRKMDFQTGLLCGLTNEKPSFDTFCGDHERDIVSENRTKDHRPNWAADYNSKITVRNVLVVLLLMFSAGRFLLGVAKQFVPESSIQDIKDKQMDKLLLEFEQQSIERRNSQNQIKDHRLINANNPITVIDSTIVLGEGVKIRLYDRMTVINGMQNLKRPVVAHFKDMLMYAYKTPIEEGVSSYEQWLKLQKETSIDLPYYISGNIVIQDSLDIKRSNFFMTKRWFTVKGANDEIQGVVKILESKTNRYFFTIVSRKRDGAYISNTMRYCMKP